MNPVIDVIENDFKISDQENDQDVAKQMSQEKNSISGNICTALDRSGKSARVKFEYTNTKHSLEGSNICNVMTEYSVMKIITKKVQS